MLLSKRQSISYQSAEAAGVLPPSSRQAAPPMPVPSSSKRTIGPGGLLMDELAQDHFDGERCACVGASTILTTQTSRACCRPEALTSMLSASSGPTCGARSR